MSAVVLLLVALSLQLFLQSCGDSAAPEQSVTFKVVQTEILFSSKSETKQIYVESQQMPSAVSDATWLHLSAAERNGDSMRVWVIEVNVEENNGEEERNASLTVTAGVDTALVKLTQVAGDRLDSDDPDDPDKASYSLPEISYPTDDNIGETANEAVANIFAGWNIGNSLEVPDGETAWGNPAVSKTLIDGVKAAGFNAVRIPCAWSSHLVSDAEPFIIDPMWMKRVREVVDYAYGSGMYVIINTHWDGGWLELHANANDRNAVVKKESAIWTQIAGEFKNYGQRLIFAGNNEIRNMYDDNENWGMPSKDEREALEAYNQVFVDAVRATGGNNTQRNLVVQSWCCNPWRALDALTMPSDSVASHLMAEVHFYDPMDFTHTDTKLQSWGYRKGYYNADNNNQEDYIDNLFGLLKAAFVDKGYPLILGEYGTVCHSISDKEVKKSDLYYLEYVTKTAKDNGMAPFYWDNGQPKPGTFGIFNRTTGVVAIPHMLNGIMKGACSGKYPQ